MTAIPLLDQVACPVYLGAWSGPLDGAISLASRWRKMVLRDFWSLFLGGRFGGSSWGVTSLHLVDVAPSQDQGSWLKLQGICHGAETEIVNRVEWQMR